MQEYVTEFNYLFHQIYRCATITKVDDTNYKDFYSFGNDARKFLEIYLFYCYPDTTMTSEEKLKRFFGEDGIPTTLVDRINNEYSHLCGVFERGATLIDQPEMHTCAQRILQGVQRMPEQYASLLRSIGETNAADLFLSTASKA